MPKQTGARGRRWYVIHTQSGYEDNVAENLRQRIQSMDMEDKIFNVLVPVEKKIKIKNGKRKVISEKILPSYVLVEMIVTDDSWYVVRNTPNVTGFVGAETTPEPLTEKEIKSIQSRMGVDEPTVSIEIEVGTSVKIIDGPFKGHEGRVDEVDEKRGKVKVSVLLFGRETPVELDPLQIKKV